LALGVDSRQFLATVFREASLLSAVGIVSGVGASFLVTQLVKSMLYGIAPYDPVTLVLLLIVALGATGFLSAGR
jgi:ABC-type antimicrobial peptide transport system permease subunit